MVLLALNFIQRTKWALCKNVSEKCETRAIANHA